MWVWNAPRNGFQGSPVNQHVVDKNRAAGKVPVDLQKKATFTNAGTEPSMKTAKLFFQETYWGDLGFGDPPLHVNTYEGHQWNVKVGEEIVRTFVTDTRPVQPYII